MPFEQFYFIGGPQECRVHAASAGGASPTGARAESQWHVVSVLHGAPFLQVQAGRRPSPPPPPKRLATLNSQIFETETTPTVAQIKGGGGVIKGKVGHGSQNCGNNICCRSDKYVAHAGGGGVGVHAAPAQSYPIRTARGSLRRHTLPPRKPPPLVHVASVGQGAATQRHVVCAQCPNRRGTWPRADKRPLACCTEGHASAGCLSPGSARLGASGVQRVPGIPNATCGPLVLSSWPDPPSWRISASASHWGPGKKGWR